jgi:hypothetical protein
MGLRFSASPLQLVLVVCPRMEEPVLLKNRPSSCPSNCQVPRDACPSFTDRDTHRRLFWRFVDNSPVTSPTHPRVPTEDRATSVVQGASSAQSTPHVRFDPRTAGTRRGSTHQRVLLVAVQKKRQVFPRAKQVRRSWTRRHHCVSCFVFPSGRQIGSRKRLECFRRLGRRDDSDGRW